MKNNFRIDHYIDTIWIFEDLNKEEKKFWAKHVDIRHLEKNDFIFKENMPRKYLYIICEGKLELFKTNPFGEEKRLGIYEKHQIIGEGALIEDLPHTTSGRILEKTTVMTIDAAFIADFFKLYPVSAGRIIMKIAKSVSRLMRMNSARAANIASRYFTGKTRTENDLLGSKEIPFENYFGVQTFRALENFYISGISISHHPEIIEALAMIKKSAAKANRDLNILPENIADAIVKACDEIISGNLHSHFVVDLIQGGAGTSTNMNANEVISNRALELLGHKKGEYKYCHPNNHVNLSQSTNDVYPSALKIALIKSNAHMMEAMHQLIISFRKKGVELSNIIKMGRTQLQDAVPMTLGQEFDLCRGS